MLNCGDGVCPLCTFYYLFTFCGLCTFLLFVYVLLLGHVLLFDLYSVLFFVILFACYNICIWVEKMSVFFWLIESPKSQSILGLNVSRVLVRFLCAYPWSSILIHFSDRAQVTEGFKAVSSLYRELPANTSASKYAPLRSWKKIIISSRNT